MAEPAPQNYDNHVFIPKKFFVVAIAFIIAAILATVGLLNTGTTMGTCFIGTALLIHALSGVYGLLMMRGYAVKLQDRIIRAEMRARLAEILPDDLKEASKSLTMRQLIGLRFASDEEMADLVSKVLDEKIEKADPIKKLVQDWQADHDRV